VPDIAAHNIEVRMQDIRQGREHHRHRRHRHMRVGALAGVDIETVMAVGVFFRDAEDRVGLRFAVNQMVKFFGIDGMAKRLRRRDNHARQEEDKRQHKNRDTPHTVVVAPLLAFDQFDQFAVRALDHRGAAAAVDQALERRRLPDRA
jgi:hypothetical protein